MSVSRNDIDWQQVGRDMAEAGLELNRKIREMFASLDASMARLRARRDALDPEQRERASEARYRRAVAAERRIGLAHVKAEAYRVRKELGLPTAPVLYNDERAVR